jgi:hypothetical protein
MIIATLSLFVKASATVDPMLDGLICFIIVGAICSTLMNPMMGFVAYKTKNFLPQDE